MFYKFITIDIDKIKVRKYRNLRTANFRKYSDRQCRTKHRLLKSSIYFRRQTIRQLFMDAS